METLDLVRLLLGSGFLGYAAARDLVTRRVPNAVWLAFGACAFLLFLADLLVTRRFDWTHPVIGAGVIVLAYGLWYVHLLAGGADAKALMVLAVLLPAPVEWQWADVALPAWPSPIPGALVVLANSLVLFAAAPLGLAAYNLVRGDLRFPAMFLGYRLSIEAAEASFVWIVDRVRPDGSLGQVLFPSRLGDEEYRENVGRLREKGRSRVWVTPKIPFMLPLLGGYMAAFLLGDVLFRLVLRIVVGV